MGSLRLDLKDVMDANFVSCLTLSANMSTEYNSNA